tara:strand:+ start:678 stop:893 length:216 start_codon:yes stop_codon:yes gene_type:complete
MNKNTWLYECKSGEQTVFTIIKKDSQLKAGTVFNVGFCELYEWDISGGGISLDDDITDFIDYIEECESMQI